jgi:AcrR family transcriptional regulator
MGIQERKERERERRRQQIIVAAKRAFSEKGFNRATMEDIAREAELSPGTLYLYFKNKDELYASLSLRILLIRAHLSPFRSGCQAKDVMDRHNPADACS